MRVAASLEGLFEDLRIGTRLLHKSPGFAALVILTLAIGISANTAIFSLANAAFFRALPYPHAERLAFLWQSNQRTGQSEGLVSYPNFSDWRSQSHSFSDMAFFMSGKSILSGSGEAERTPAALVSVNFFSVLGVSPVLGRSFSPEEQSPGHANVAVISYHLWRTRFAGDPQILGRELPSATSLSHTIVGVMPAGFAFPDNTDIWIPKEVFEFYKTKARQYPNQRVIGRLNTGVTWTQAQTELDTIAGQLAKEYPAADGGVGVRIVPLPRQFSAKVRQSLLILWCAIGGVLLLACLNAANIFLVRAAGREKEISVRYSLGATRTRILRQFLCESFLLAFFAAVVGVPFAVWIVNALSKLNPSDLATLGSSVLDVRVLAYTVVISASTALVCGLLPAFASPRIDLTRALRDTGTGQSVPRVHALRKFFLVAQVSVAFVLLVGSGLLVKSLWRIFAVPPGFEAENVLSLHVYWPDAAQNAADNQKRNSLYQEIMMGLRSLPGVTSVGSTSNVLFPGEMYRVPFVIEGQPEQPAGQRPFLPHGGATPDFFRTMGIPLLRGRVFEQRDTMDGAPEVILINETMARRYWPDEDPIGKRLRFDDPNFKSPWFTIVGVVGDVRQEGLELPAGLMSYGPSAGYWGDDIVLRSQNDPRNLIASVRQQIRSTNPNLAIDNVNVVGDLLSSRESLRRFNALLLSGLALVALLLAAVGIYGTISYWVRQRTHEFGVRMALGAEQQNIVGLVLRSGMQFIVAGLVLGVAGSLAAARIIASSLFDVAPSDPATFAAITALLFIVALAACWIPARRTLRIDPITALRHE